MSNARLHVRSALAAAFCLAALGLWRNEVRLPEAAAAPPSPQPRVVEAWTVLPTHSFTYIHVEKTGLGHEHAVSGMVLEGSLDLGASEKPGRIVFDMKSFTADSDAARKFIGLSGTTSAGTQAQVTANMLGDGVLDVAKHPTAEFVVQSSTRLEQPSKRGFPVYKLRGEFTLHGATRTIEVLAEAEPSEGWIRLRGQFSILQSEYGMKPYTAALGAVGVADRLTIHADFLIAAERKVLAAQR